VSLQADLLVVLPELMLAIGAMALLLAGASGGASGGLRRGLAVSGAGRNLCL
jgi:hypothetical protein